MRADYDSTANAISIAITDAQHADGSDEVHARAIVALAAGRPVEVQLLYPDLGITEPLAAVGHASKVVLGRREQPLDDRRHLRFEATCCLHDRIDLGLRALIRNAAPAERFAWLGECLLGSDDSSEDAG